MRIDKFIFGYRTVKVKEEDIGRAATALLKRNLSASISSNGSIDVPLYKYKKYHNALKNTEHDTSNIKGLVSYAINNRKRYGIFAGALVGIIYIIFSTLFIWDIRIDGNEYVTSAKIEEELESVGFCRGALWMSLALSETETEFLNNSSSVGWISINRRGCVAYVSVREKSSREEIYDVTGFSNIVAATDCVIEEITVKSGIACVKAGDTVKAGELLISGIIPIELGGGFVRASGEVQGRISEQISVEVSRNESIKEYKNMELCEADVKIFKFSLNIFKRYRNNDTPCVIIEDVEKYAVFGKYRLPLEVRKKYYQQIVQRQAEYSDSDLISIASVRLKSLMISTLREAELTGIKTQGYFTEEGYKITSDVSALVNIGEERFFSK